MVSGRAFDERDTAEARPDGQTWWPLFRCGIRGRGARRAPASHFSGRNWS